MAPRTENASAYIDGHWRVAAGPPLEVLDPSTGRHLATLASASAADVGEALDAAQRAQYAWAHLPAPVRGRHLRALADVIAAHRTHLAAIIGDEMGKPIRQALAEVDFATELVRYSAEWDRRLEGEILPGDVADEVIHLLHAPIGVVAAICPWNFPLAVLCRKLGPALVTGNTLVAKPSEISPLSTIELFRLIDDELELPDGVLNLVNGAATTGRALVENPGTDMVSFTGHRDTGKEIMALASGRLTRIALELGGKAPAIVCRDADLDVAVPAIVAARYTNTGQVCTSAERVLVDDQLLERFVERFVLAAQSLRLGPPAGAEVDLGPLASADQLAKTERVVSTARAEGATVLTGGGRPDGEGFGDGYWYAPTVIAEVTPNSSIMGEETFGPVTPILGVSSTEEALEIANNSRYGLSAYVFSDSYETVMRAVDELKFGEIYINRTLGESVHAHHAGYRESGIGGEDGRWGLLRYTQVKTAYHHYGR